MGRSRKVSGGADEDGWEDVSTSSVSVANVASDYKEGGKHFVESGFDFNTASAGELKAKLGNMRVGETKTLVSAHTWKVQKNIKSEPGQKMCRFRVVETDSLNGGDTPTETSTSLPGEDGSNPQGLTPLQILKNFTDNIAAEVRQHKNWLIAIGMVAAVALVLGGMTIVKIFF